MSMEEILRLTPDPDLEREKKYREEKAERLRLRGSAERPVPEMRATRESGWDKLKGLFPAKSGGEDVATALESVVRGDAEFPQKPSIKDTKEWKENVPIPHKAAALISDPEDIAQTFVNWNPEGGYRTQRDKQGNVVVADKKGVVKGYGNKPGGDTDDLIKFGAEAATYGLPGGAAVKLTSKAGKIKRLLSVVTAEVGADSALQSLDLHEGWQPTRTGMAAVTAPLALFGGRIIEDVGSAALKKRYLEEGREIAKKMGITDPGEEVSLGAFFHSKGMTNLKDIPDEAFHAKQQGFDMTEGDIIGTFGEKGRERALIENIAPELREVKGKQIEQFGEYVRTRPDGTPRYSPEELAHRESLAGGITGEATKVKKAANIRYEKAKVDLQREELPRGSAAELDQVTTPVIDAFEKDILGAATTETGKMQNTITAWRTTMANLQKGGASLDEVRKISENVNSGLKAAKKAGNEQEVKFFTRMKEEVADWEDKDLMPSLGKDQAEVFDEFRGSRKQYAESRAPYQPEGKEDIIGRQMQRLTRDKGSPKQIVGEIFGTEDLPSSLEKNTIQRVLKGTPPKKRKEMNAEVKQLIDNRIFGSPKTGAAKGTPGEVQRVRDGLYRVLEGDLKDVGDHLYTKAERREMGEQLKFITNILKVGDGGSQAQGNLYARLPEIGGARAVLNMATLRRWWNRPEVRRRARPLSKRKSGKSYGAAASVINPTLLPENQ